MLAWRSGSRSCTGISSKKTRCSRDRSRRGSRWRRTCQRKSWSSKINSRKEKEEELRSRGLELQELQDNLTARIRALEDELAYKGATLEEKENEILKLS